MTAQSVSEAAEHLWSCVTRHGGAPADIGAAAERLCNELRTELGRWIGVDGFATLAHRAFVISRAQHPALTGLSCLGGSPAEDTAEVATQTYGAAEVAAGMVAWLTAVIELLGRIIGDEMAMQLVAQMEIPSSRAVASIGSKEDRNG